VRLFPHASFSSHLTLHFTGYGPYGWTDTLRKDELRGSPHCWQPPENWIIQGSQIVDFDLRQTTIK